LPVGATSCRSLKVRGAGLPVFPGLPVAVGPARRAGGGDDGVPDPFEKLRWRTTRSPHGSRRGACRDTSGPRRPGPRSRAVPGAGSAPGVRSPSPAYLPQAVADLALRGVSALRGRSSASGAAEPPDRRHSPARAGVRNGVSQRSGVRAGRTREADGGSIDAGGLLLRNRLFAFREVSSLVVNK
jgi:hypothetical protein